METIGDQRSDQLGRAVTWSLIGHGAIAFLIVLKSLVFPGNPIMIAPALRVDLVGLPDLLKKDLVNVPKTPAPSDLEKKLAEAGREAKNIKPIPQEEAAKPEEMVLNPKKVEKKPIAAEDKEKAKESKDKAKKIDSALARIRALERLKDKADADKPDTGDDDAVVIKGNQVSKGTSLSGDAREKAQAGYYDQIRESLVEYWALPAWLTREKLSAQVQMRIDPSGRVLSTKFVKPSGNAAFDAAILATIKDSQPLPRPPKELLSSLSDDGVIVGFPL
jgi:TonB family protein